MFSIVVQPGKSGSRFGCHRSSLFSIAQRLPHFRCFIKMRTTTINVPQPETICV